MRPHAQLWIYTRPHLHAHTRPHKHVFAQELDLLVGWGSRKLGNTALAWGEASCSLGPSETFDPMYQGAQDDSTPP